MSRKPTVKKASGKGLAWNSKRNFGKIKVVINNDNFRLTRSSAKLEIPAEIRDFYEAGKSDPSSSLKESRFHEFCNDYYRKNSQSVRHGISKHFWRLLRWDSSQSSLTPPPDSSAARNVHIVNYNNVNIHSPKAKVNGTSEPEVKPMSEGDAQRVNNSQTEECPQIVDLTTCDCTCREAHLEKMPEIPPANGNFTRAFKLFSPVLVKEPILVLPSYPLEETQNSEFRFYFFYLHHALLYISNLSKKLSQPVWGPEIKEGWFDANVWPCLIDYLFSRSSTLTLLRKELAIIETPGPERYDGIFRHIRHGLRFDLGVIEVGCLSERPNSDTKPTTDRDKIVRAMRHMLQLANKRCDSPDLQVVGMLCSVTGMESYIDANGLSRQSIHSP